MALRRSVIAVNLTKNHLLQALRTHMVAIVIDTGSIGATPCVLQDRCQEGDDKNFLATLDPLVQ